MRDSISRQMKLIVVGAAVAFTGLSMTAPAVFAAPAVETAYSIAQYLPIAPPASLGVPAKGNKPYVFMSVGPDGSPDRWNPCKPITWGVVAKGFPKEELPHLKKAFATISKATGLTFVYTGVAKKYTYDDYGHMPSIPNVDISLAYEDFRKTTPSYAGAAGYGGRNVGWSSSSPLRHVGPGQARFDLSDLGRLTSVQNTALYLHELGHVIGLDHVKDPTSIMYPSVSKVSRYSAADLAGLALLGKQAGDCVPGAPFYDEVNPPPAPDGSTAAPAPATNLTATRTPDGGLLIAWNDPAGSIVTGASVSADSTNPNSEWYGLYGNDELEGPNGQYLVYPSDMEKLAAGETFTITVSLSNDSGHSKPTTIKLTW